MTKPNLTSGYAWYRAYVPMYSEVLAEETPYGIEKEYTQKASSSVDMSKIRPVEPPSYRDNNGVRMKRNLRGPWGHCA